MQHRRSLIRLSSILVLFVLSTLPVRGQTGINPNMARRKTFRITESEDIFSPTEISGEPSAKKKLKDAQELVNDPAEWQKAANLCISQPGEFRSALRMKQQYPGAFLLLFTDKVPAALAVRFAILADSLADTAKFRDWIANKWGPLKEYSAQDKEGQITEMRVSASALRAALRKYNEDIQKPSGAVYAEGALSSMIGHPSSEGGAQKALSGSLGAQFKFSNWSISLSLSLASSIDTLRGHASYAQALLTPSYGDGGLKSALIDAQYYFRPRCGIHGYFSWSQTLWGSDTIEINKQLKADTALAGRVAKAVAQDSSTIFGNASSTSLGLGILGFYSLGGGEDSSAVWGTIEAGLVGRYLVGNVAHNADYLSTHMYTDTQLFYGLEVGAQLVFSKIVMHVELYALTGSGSAVDGLTGAQVAGRVSIQAPIAEF